MKSSRSESALDPNVAARDLALHLLGRHVQVAKHQLDGPVRRDVEGASQRLAKDGLCELPLDAARVGMLVAEPRVREKYDVTHPGAPLHEQVTHVLVLWDCVELEHGIDRQDHHRELTGGRERRLMRCFLLRRFFCCRRPSRANGVDGNRETQGRGRGADDER